MSEKFLSYCVPLGTIQDPPKLDIEIKEASGEHLIDSNGKRYLDMRSGLWNISLGYNNHLNKRFSEVFGDILNKNIPFIDLQSYNHTLYDALASSLLEFLNEEGKIFHKVFYTNSGSEGTELAIKLCKQLNNERETVVAFKEGYHGTYFGGMSVSGLDEEITKKYEPKLKNTNFISYPKCEEDLNRIISYLSEDENISSFFIEPVIGSSGTIKIKDSYLNEILKTCKQNNIIVIFDEVATGFFRTGERFKYQDLEHHPDMVILSKAINNGVLPFGALAINQEVSDRLRGQHIEHYSTQNGNLLGVASALETLKYFIEVESIIKKNVIKIEKIYTDVLSSAGIGYRGTGAMLSIPLRNQEEMQRILGKLKKFGILTYYYINLDGECGLTLFPPLLIEEKTFNKAMKLIAKTISDY